jgi:hypothetical protein
MIQPKRALRRVQLNAAVDESLRQVLRRDGWRSQSCGTTAKLEGSTTRNSVAILATIQKKINHAVQTDSILMQWLVVPRFLRPHLGWTHASACGSTRGRVP